MKISKVFCKEMTILSFANIIFLMNDVFDSIMNRLIEASMIDFLISESFRASFVKVILMIIKFFDDETILCSIELFVNDFNLTIF